MISSISMLLSAALDSIHKAAIRFCRIMEHDEDADPFRYEEDKLSNDVFSVQADERGRGKEPNFTYRTSDGRTLHIRWDLSGQVSCDEELTADDICEMLYRCSNSLNLSI